MVLTTSFPSGRLRPGPWAPGSSRPRGSCRLHMLSAPAAGFGSRCRCSRVWAPVLNHRARLCGGGRWGRGASRAGGSSGGPGRFHFFRGPRRRSLEPLLRPTQRASPAAPSTPRNPAIAGPAPPFPLAASARPLLCRQPAAPAIHLVRSMASTSWRLTVSGGRPRLGRMGNAPGAGTRGRPGGPRRRWRSPEGGERAEEAQGSRRRLGR